MHTYFRARDRVYIKGKNEKIPKNVLFLYIPFLNSEFFGCKVTKKHPTPSDDRSRALNPTSTDYKAVQDNRSRQLNEQDPVYHSSHGGKKK